MTAVNVEGLVCRDRKACDAGRKLLEDRKARA